MTEPMGNSPRHEDNEFERLVNEAGRQPEGAARFRAALDEGGGDLLGSLRALVGEGAVASHVEEYVSEHPQYEPILLGVMAAVAAGTVSLAFAIVETTAEQALTIDTDEQIMHLALRAI